MTTNDTCELLLEEKRLQDLRSYEILDTSSDINFDQIAILAAAICQTPVALISLVDKNRQWFKAKVGFDVSESPRLNSFCAHAIDQEQIFQITDAKEDIRFRHHPFVSAKPNIRFYAGALLVSPNGMNLGTLCVIDLTPKKLNSEQLAALKILADQVVSQMELFKANKNLLLAKYKIEMQQKLLINKAQMQSISELSGGICHQINNPLAILMGRSMILKSMLSEEELKNKKEISSEIETIDSTLIRISAIVSNLRTYATELGSKKDHINLSGVVQSALDLMSSKLKAAAVKTEVLSTGTIVANVNEDQLLQVLINLMENSLDAMEETQEKILTLNTFEEQDSWIISVSDNGTGINPADKEKIFKAFVSTKARHFGIGLSNAKNFIEQHAGTLTLEHHKDPTTFKISLPKTF